MYQREGGVEKCGVQMVRIVDFVTCPLEAGKAPPAKTHNAQRTSVSVFGIMFGVLRVEANR